MLTASLINILYTPMEILIINIACEPATGIVYYSSVFLSPLAIHHRWALGGQFWMGKALESSRISDLTWLDGAQGSNGRLLGMMHHRDGENSKIWCFPGTFEKGIAAHWVAWTGRRGPGAQWCILLQCGKRWFQQMLADWNLKSLHFKLVTSLVEAITTFHQGRKVSL